MDEDLLALLSYWELGGIRSLAPTAAGTVNRTFLVDADSGRYILRIYRHRDRAPVAREHAVIAHLRSNGFPAVGPLPLRTGGTILEVAGIFHALFPSAPGHQVTRRALSPAEARAMGTCLARLHRALHDLPSQLGMRRSFAIDRDATLATIAQIEAVIRARADPDAADAMALAWLAGQRDWLTGPAAGTSVDLTSLEWQVIHGDYQETNLFFDDTGVCAVIDWDQTYLAPRAWEVVRSMHFALGFAPSLCAPYIAAYRAILPLPLVDLDRAVAAYARKIGHDTWLYQEYYLRGNPRVGQFFQPGGFRSPADQWAPLRQLLAP